MTPATQMPPPSLRPFGPGLASAARPTAPFNPDGAWKHTYALWITGPQAETPAERRGRLTISRTPVDSTTARLNVTREAVLYGTETAHYSDHYACDMLCRTDRLATPVSWRVRSETRATGRPLNPWVVYERSGSFDLATLSWESPRRRTRRVSGPCTTNWSLLDAVQRLPLRREPALAFDLLEEAELLKTGHALCFGDTQWLDFGGARTTVHGFEQVGSGIYPQHYWLDEHRRLTVFTDGFRAFILERAEPAGEGA